MLSGLCASGQCVRGSHRLAAMWAAFDELSIRTDGRRVHSPAGQNGSDCILFAVLDQMDELLLRSSLPRGLDASALRELTRAWMRKNGTLPLESGWASSSSQCSGMLRDFGSDYSDFLHDEKAHGNHVVLLAICAVLTTLLGKELRALVREHSALPTHAASLTMPCLFNFSHNAMPFQRRSTPPRARRTMRPYAYHERTCRQSCWCLAVR